MHSLRLSPPHPDEEHKASVADGVGGAAAVKFAILSAALTLHNTDFLVA